MNNKKVKVFSTPTCHYCHKAKDFLAENDIEFEDHDVTKDPNARKEMLDTSGQMAVPVILIGEDVVIGFNEPIIRELLNIES